VIVFPPSRRILGFSDGLMCIVWLWPRTSSDTPSSTVQHARLLLLLLLLLLLCYGLSRLTVAVLPRAKLAV
jgi:hypothetical protein